MSRTQQSYPRRGCSIGCAVRFSEVAVAGNSFTPVEKEEIQAVIRFWKRRAFYSFSPVETVNGETNFEIDLQHLSYALSRIHYYEQLLEVRK
jgi:hypothetical protein